eukprot:3265988-Rhodomonas_salina.1
MSFFAMPQNRLEEHRGPCSYEAAESNKIASKWRQHATKMYLIVPQQNLSYRTSNFLMAAVMRLAPRHKPHQKPLETPLHSCAKMRRVWGGWACPVAAIVLVLSCAAGFREATALATGHPKTWSVDDVCEWYVSETFQTMWWGEGGWVSRRGSAPAQTRSS